MTGPVRVRRRLGLLLVVLVTLLTAGWLDGGAGPSAHGGPTRPGGAQSDGPRADRQPGPPSATLVRSERSAPRTVDLTIDSPALGREVGTRVLLPPGFDTRPERRWPVLYLLHGCCYPGESYRLWTEKTDVETVTASLEALVVMPEGGPVGYYSDWWHGGRGGADAWETFHLTELRQVLERTLRAGDRRAVAGVSMGGTGAMLYAARNPGVFTMAASFSGRLDTQADADAVLRKVARFTPDPTALWGDPQAQSAVWAAHNPQRLLEALPAGFPVYVSCGDGRPGPMDGPKAGFSRLEAQFDGMAEAFVDRARERGLHVTAHRYGAGTHTWRYWARELATALPQLASALGV
ncbi:alpha/beta hydrolase family protein [Streptomyces sp. 549]|nr:alpha/beta hydrolase family protein [Streptomyces sp. 549]